MLELILAGQWAFDMNTSLFAPARFVPKNCFHPVPRGPRAPISGAGPGNVVHAQVQVARQ
eukprot:6220766-Alexandrium_andersonii.AAC.1